MRRLAMSVVFVCGRTADQPLDGQQIAGADANVAEQSLVAR